MEIMVSLLNDSLPKWFDKRCSSVGGAGFNARFGDPHKNDSIKFLKQRISSFSSSLENFRITKIEATSKPIQDIDTCYSDECTEMVRIISFYLGNEKDYSLVVVKIILDENYESECSLVRNMWSPWIPSRNFTIVCLNHPKPEFIDYTVLGMVDTDD